MKLALFNESTSNISAVSLPFLQGPPRALELSQLPPLQDHHPVATELLQREEAPVLIWVLGKATENKLATTSLTSLKKCWIYILMRECLQQMSKKLIYIRPIISEIYMTASQEMHGTHNALFTTSLGVSQLRKTLQKILAEMHLAKIRRTQRQLQQNCHIHVLLGRSFGFCHCSSNPLQRLARLHGKTSINLIHNKISSYHV